MSSTSLIRKIVSGGQTGVDRAALDWAIAHNVPHGGWCPRGRRAEDGIIAPPYQLQETPHEDYAQRTEWNVRDSDGTLIISQQAQLSGGTLLTQTMALQYNRPCIHLHQDLSWNEIEFLFEDFIENHDMTILNIAGPRASQEPQVRNFALILLDTVIRSHL